MPLSQPEILRKFRKEGCPEQQGARHIKFFKNGVWIPVPRSKKDLKPGTYHKIMKDAGWK
jgi:predicted RNA binding protein YcfA (HicA-like mRNA interferase family)